jgi:DNA polymerase-3 subunit delta
VDSSVFILVGTKLDKRKKFFRQLSEASLSVEFKKPFENQVPGWISHICRAHELEISEEAVLLVHRLVGSQLLEIETEVKKLKNFIGAGRTRVELEDVAQVVSARKEENVFALTESIAEGDRIKSLVRLVELLDNGQSEVGIVALIARHLRILLIIKQGLEQGLAGQRLAQLAQVPSYFLQDYVRQAKAWTYRRLESSLIVLAETDKALKSSPLSSHIWLENMVLKIASFQGMPKAESNQATVQN